MQKNVFHSVYFIRINVMEKMQCQSPMSHLAHNSAHSAMTYDTINGKISFGQRPRRGRIPVEHMGTFVRLLVFPSP